MGLIVMDLVVGWICWNVIEEFVFGEWFDVNGFDWDVYEWNVFWCDLGLM